ncbi:MAG TPA: VWA domain-containing protein [Casimicrobiaceae bacterium]|nr:VWA domain-containing protein [Casimicrobiaceae bacterium]
MSTRAIESTPHSNPLHGGGREYKAHLADNVLYFVRVLRAAGLPVGPAKVIDALAAVEAVGVENRTDFREALAAVLVSRREHLAVFEQAFDMFWRNPRLLEKMIAALLPRIRGRVPDAAEDLPARLAQAMLPPAAMLEADDERETDLDAALSFSAREVLQRKDFATMTADELAEVKALLRRIKLPLPARPVRRTVASSRGHAIDLRATLRRSVGANAALAPLRYRARRRRPPPLCVLCDISGSMDRYARMLLHFLHAITNDRHRVHVLTFGTRLTNITRHLRHRDVDVALARVADAVADWAGGTRIGVCLTQFNRGWSRRLLGQNAVVLLISDGLDADAGEGLAFEAERLAKSCARLVWLNPLLRYPGFEARPAGIRALLPYVDDFLPVHNLETLTDLAKALAAPHRRAVRSVAV